MNMQFSKAVFFNIEENKNLKMSQPFEKQGQKIFSKLKYFPSNLAPEYMHKSYWPSILDIHLDPLDVS